MLAMIFRTAGNEPAAPGLTWRCRTISPVFDLVGVTVRRGSAVPLADVSLTIRGGRCTALVGPSGAGKSTLLRLLNRFEDPSEGEVRLHDRPLTSYDVQELRRIVGLVSQTPVLLTGQVLDDLRVGQPDLAQQEAADLLHRVGLPAGFVERPTARSVRRRSAAGLFRPGARRAAGGAAARRADLRPRYRQRGRGRTV